MSELPEIQDLKRITYSPDDVIVARVGRPVSAQEAHQIKTQLQDAFPGRKVLVIDPTVEIDVAAPEPKDGQP
jgi:hypothetical protein